MDHEKEIKIDAAEKHSLMFQCIPCYYLVSALPKMQLSGLPWLFGHKSGCFIY